MFELNDEQKKYVLDNVEKDKEKTLKVGMLCGGRSSQQTFNQFISIYEKAKELGLKDVEFHFIDPALQSTIDKAIECINYYAIENEDYSKIYSTEEQDLLKILEGE